MKDYTVGIDIGGTNTVFGLVDKSGMIRDEGMIITTDYPEAEDFVETLAERIKTISKADPGIKIRGIGIGAPNGNYYKGTIEQAPNLTWKGVVPMARMIEEKLNIPVVLTNDANAAAVGEMMFGGASDMKDFIILTLGTGLGSGIVINGEVVYGHSGFAGEYGHVIMVQDGRECGCGRYGCLETYVSASGIVRTVQWLLSEMKDESILRNYHPEKMSSKLIAEAAIAKDNVALEAFDYTAEMLAIGIVNAVVFSSPQAIFLFGGLANAGNLLLEPLKKYVDELIQPIFRNTFEILPSGIPESNAAVLGSAALAWKALPL